jgi:2-keto-4-pentenoate hydratase
MQAQMGVDTPDFGVLLDDMQIADNGVMRLDEFVQPRIEAEIALVLAHDLGAGATVQDVLDGAEQAFPALEIIDSRIRDWRLTLIDTVADNASSGAYVLGPPVPARRFELGDVEVVLNLNGVERARGFGSAALGHPAAAAAWLANRLADFGTTLTAGSVVLTGSLHASLPLARDDRVQADFGEFGSANVVVG